MTSWWFHLPTLILKKFRICRKESTQRKSHVWHHRHPGAKVISFIVHLNSCSMCHMLTKTGCLITKIHSWFNQTLVIEILSWSSNLQQTFNSPQLSVGFSFEKWSLPPAVLRKSIRPSASVDYAGWICISFVMELRWTIIQEYVCVYVYMVEFPSLCLYWYWWWALFSNILLRCFGYFCKIWLVSWDSV